MKFPRKFWEGGVDSFLSLDSLEAKTSILWVYFSLNFLKETMFYII